MSEFDRHWIRVALRLARRGLGNVWPNPAVGCVLLRQGADGHEVIGRGWTQSGGRPHAEAEALRRARSAFGPGVIRGAVAFVSLEPCDHYGETLPCSRALVEAGVARVVVACEDPDPRVAGAGLRRLRNAGVEVVDGVCEADARELNAGFFMRLTKGRPLVTLKCASTMDGRIAAHGGRSKWITGQAARARGHLLRAQSDAIVVGVGTALADDPDLTCRLPGLESSSPVRVVIDSRLRLPLASKLVATAEDRPTWLITRDDSAREHLDAYREAGVETIQVAPNAHGKVDLAAGLSELARRGITRLLVEGGAKLSAGLLEADLVDRLAWFRAPSLLGGDGLSAIAALGLDAPEEAPRFAMIERIPLDQDMLETYVHRV